jgi:hypothetical protein
LEPSKHFINSSSQGQALPSEVPEHHIKLWSKEISCCILKDNLHEVPEGSADIPFFLLTLDLSRDLRSFSNSSNSDSGILKWKLS